MKTIAVFVFSFVALSGCVSSLDLTKVANNQAIPDPLSDKAQIVFLRPSGGNYGAFSAVVFDITGTKPEIIGAAPSWSKFIANMSPGKRRLLATLQGGQGHVMEVNVDSGRRYFVLVRTIWGQGFQLRPLRQNSENDYSQSNPDFPGWLSKTELVQMTSKEVREWETKSEKLIVETLSKAEEVWEKKSDSQHAQLTLSNTDSEAK